MGRGQRIDWIVFLQNDSWRVCGDEEGGSDSLVQLRCMREENGPRKRLRTEDSIVNKIVTWFSITLVFFLSFSCKDTSTDVSPTALRVEQLRNVPYMLNRVIVRNSALNLNAYEPFHFLLGDSTVFGDDGCNAYQGRFALDDQTFTIYYSGETEKACNYLTRPQFDASLLGRRWRINILDTIILLQSRDTTFIFSSSWRNAVDHFSFTKSHWKLSSSNDTAFSFLSSVDLLPKFEITTNREFQFQWYYAPRNQIFPSNSLNGVYGVGDAQSILFYSTGWAYDSPSDAQVFLRDMLFLRRILKSTRYSYSETSFTLEMPSSGVYYNFTLDR